MNIFRIKFESYDKVMLLATQKEIMTSYLFFQNKIILRNGISNFADIIKIVIKLIETTLKNSIIIKESQIPYQNAIFIFISGYNQNCKFLVENANIHRSQELLNVIYIFFKSSLT